MEEIELAISSKIDIPSNRLDEIQCALRSFKVIPLPGFDDYLSKPLNEIEDVINYETKLRDDPDEYSKLLSKFMSTFYHKKAFFDKLIISVSSSYEMETVTAYLIKDDPEKFRRRILLEYSTESLTLSSIVAEHVGE